MMTKKDFERIAQVFRVGNPKDVRSVTYSARRLMWLRMLDDMCVELRAINPRFDEDKFRKACNGL